MGDVGGERRHRGVLPRLALALQRPSNEHMNGLLRRYFPKGTDLNLVSRGQLRAVAIEMNGRPRKVLNRRTPAQIYVAMRTSWKDLSWGGQ